jgi:hypothetical protein
MRATSKLPSMLQQVLHCRLSQPCGSSMHLTYRNSRPNSLDLDGQMWRVSADQETENWVRDRGWKFVR